MIINKKRIHNIKKYLQNFTKGSKVYVCVLANEQNKNILTKRGIISEYVVGQTVIPIPVGPITEFNLNGKDIVHKEQEKEKRTFEREYHVVDWHGQDHYGTCYPTIECYPKEFIFPPLERMTLGKDYIKSRLFEIEEDALIKHVINMFLEVFGNCILTDNVECPMVKEMKVKTVRWRILPPGKYPWDKAEKELDEYFSKVKTTQKAMVEKRHKHITKNAPDFMAIGEDCFNGYVVYGYNKKGIYIFESNEVNNATYVFKGEWENASKLTKREIIQGDLCHQRILHTREWELKIEVLTNQE